jgi:(S)-ureidoglycine aminohydrolase
LYPQLNHLGSTRSSLKPDHLLHTPDTFIRTPLAGAAGVDFVVHIGPQLGARFTQMTAEFAIQGTLGPPPAQRFLYVLEGELLLTAKGIEHPLSKESFAFLPLGTPHTVRALSRSRAVVIEKPYQPITGPEADGAEIVVGNEALIAPLPLMGDEALRVRSLMPDSPSYDFAVNTMTYNPGAALAMVEIHVMEHGLLMLEGGGIYRLGDQWYPVEAGDFIWMAPYCPQWFGALGKHPAKYLIYKDWCRHPLAMEKQS